MEFEPDEIMILGAIKNGAKKFDKIRKETKLDPEFIDKSLEKLEKNELITVQEKKGILGKKIELYLTDKGHQEVDEKIQELEEKWNYMSTLYKSGNKQKLQQYMDDNRSFLPTMMMFGLIDMMMFSMMFSMIGMSMSDYVAPEQVPESADTGDLGADAGGDGGGFDMDIGF